MSHLQNTLLKYQSRVTTTHQPIIKDLKDCLTTWASGCFLDVFLSGSIAKGTAIAVASDLDLFVSLSNECHQNDGGLGKIYTSLFDHLNSQYPPARIQRVSVGIEAYGLKIDVTPGRKLSGNTNFHNLHLTKGGKYIQTNINKHILDVKNSGRTNEIKLLKIWRYLNDLDFPSIYLEYLTIDILKGRPTAIGNLGDNFWYLLGQLSTPTKGNPIFRVIVDPSNSNNDISDLISDNEKIRIIDQASKSRLSNNWAHIVW